MLFQEMLTFQKMKALLKGGTWQCVNSELFMRHVVN